ncbi:MAG: hypothetical protein RMX68_019530 [Aulosira sp. ZfuVER01]|nr:hypothetical protein [Aulosira sp. ZfuVER01]MDZ8002442.1 hypothetical protein [Aulosira sp. DedVER01a]MDZ8054114.1 hypothetical protein [Aulosira sp. ZfuCHP01]
MGLKNSKQGNIECLNNYGLELYNTAEEIAAAMEISIGATHVTSLRQ